MLSEPVKSSPGDVPKTLTRPIRSPPVATMPTKVVGFVKPATGMSTTMAMKTLDGSFTRTVAVPGSPLLPASELERRSENLRPGYSPSGGEAEPPGEPAAAAVPPAVTRPLPVETPKQLQLTLRGLESSWVRLSGDRREPVDGYLEPAETAAWAANEEFRLTVGKSHGVSIYLNGEEILLPQRPNMLIPDIVLNKLTLLKLEN